MLLALALLLIAFFLAGYLVFDLLSNGWMYIGGSRTAVIIAIIIVILVAVANSILFWEGVLK